MLLLEAFSQLCKALQWVEPVVASEYSWPLAGLFSGLLAGYSTRLPRQLQSVSDLLSTVVPQRCLLGRQPLTRPCPSSHTNRIGYNLHHLFLSPVAEAILGLIGFSTIRPVAGKPHSDLNMQPHVEWNPRTHAPICRLQNSFNPIGNRKCCS